MSDLTHQQMVANLAKKGQDIIDEMTPEKAHVLHMSVGVSTEAGELLSAVKKYTMYNKDIDRENVIEELGDLEFYMEGLRQGIGIARIETIAHNMHKLSTGKNARYKEGSFSNEQANERADKNGEEDDTRI